MSDTWATILALTVLSFAIRGAGPALLGGRRLPHPALRVIGLLAPALLAALVVVETFTHADGELELDARAAGLAAAAGVLAVSRRSMLAAITAAAAAAALLRAVA